MKYTVCVLFLTFVLFGSAYGFGSYCPLNPDGQCSGIQGTSSNEASGDSFFYCDVAATFVGSKSCQYLSYIDGRFPVTTAVRPDGYPIIFFASTPQHPDATFIPTFFINCYDYGCTDVSEPGLLPDINGLFGVDTAIVSEGGVDVLAVAGVGEQLSLSNLDFQYSEQNSAYGGPFGLVQSTFAQYHVVLAQSSGPECQNFTSNIPNLPPVYNAHISPVLVEIQDLPGATFPLGLTYYTVKLLIQDYYDLETNSYNWIQGQFGIHVRSDDEAEVSDKEVDEKTTTGAYNAYQAFTSTRNPDFISHYLVIVSCFDPLCQFEDEIIVPIHSSSQMTAFPGDLPWFSNDNSNNQETAFLDAEFYENAQRTLPNAPFGYNTFIPRPIFLRNKEGQVFVGLQALQRVPLSEIRGVDPCRVIQHIQEPEEVFTQEQSGHFARALDQQTKTAFGGTTNVRFFQCPNEEASNEEPFACESTEEASNFFTQSIPDPRSSVQFNGRSNARVLSLRDANVFSISDPSVRTEVNDQFNIADSSPNNYFEVFESGPTTLCQTGNPNNIPNRDVDERDIGGNMPTFVAGSAQSGLTAPASLVVGIAGNGLPAVLGISTSVTGEPSAAGWALILTVCLDAACDQQVQRYLMDSTTLHDSWGIMDDPFAAVNQILNHPDGSWAVVLFVQPQGEQIDRNGVPTNRGEGSTGKPFIINCLDETCSTAYVSNHAPNRIQSSIPYEYYDGQGNPVVINYVHSFQYVGDAAEYLLVTVRDAPFILPQDDSEIPYLPPPVRFWKTNRYASPTGFPCTPEAVGTMETVDSSLYICTRLNTGHDLNLGGVNGWVRYYEWVDVGHSFGARLWANIPAGRSPLALSLPEQNVPIVQLPIIVSFSSGPAPAPLGRGYIQSGNNYASLEGSIQTCCSTTQLLLQNGDGYDVYFDLPVHPQELQVYFASLAGYSNPLLGFFVYPIHPDGTVGQAPVFAGYDHDQSSTILSNYLYCTYLSIPLNTFQGKVSGFRILFDGATNCQTSPVCDIFIGGFKLYGSTNSGQTTNSGFPEFHSYPPELNPEFTGNYPYYCNPSSSF